jgi:hypothetical protein
MSKIGQIAVLKIQESRTVGLGKRFKRVKTS